MTNVLLKFNFMPITNSICKTSAKKNFQVPIGKYWTKKPATWMFSQWMSDAAHPDVSDIKQLLTKLASVLL